MLGSIASAVTVSMSPNRSNNIGCKAKFGHRGYHTTAYAKQKRQELTFSKGDPFAWQCGVTSWQAEVDIQAFWTFKAYYRHLILVIKRGCPPPRHNPDGDCWLLPVTSSFCAAQAEKFRATVTWIVQVSLLKQTARPTITSSFLWVQSSLLVFCSNGTCHWPGDRAEHALQGMANPLAIAMPSAKAIDKDPSALNTAFQWQLSSLLDPKPHYASVEPLPERLSIVVNSCHALIANHLSQT